MKLSEGIEQYVGHKRSQGVAFGHGQDCLMAFQKRVGDVELISLGTEHIRGFLDASQASVATWRKKHQILKQFCVFLEFSDQRPELAMPEQRQAPARQIFMPYIYSRSEIRTLLRATKAAQTAKCCVESKTLRSFLFLSYATGAIRSEVLRLKWKDVDLERGFLVLGKGGRRRRIPVGPGVQTELKKYRRWLGLGSSPGDRYLFTTKNGHPVNTMTIERTFQRLRTLAGVVRPFRSQPRMHDLHVSFAVHRITSWIRTGVDLNRMLPALAAYMGQRGLGATDRYLSLTPVHFRKQLNTLSPARRKGHWRDDPTLMRFLAAL